MRRALGCLLVATLLLVGCGDEEGESDGPSSRAPDSGWRLVEIVSAPAADGQVSTTPQPVGDEAEVARFGEQFTNAELLREIQRVVRAAEPAPGSELVAAVVAVGCDAPTQVTYAGGEVRAVKPKGPTTECFVATTWVAILEVPA